MGFLKGPVVNGVVQVKQKVKFTEAVQSGIFNPWVNTWYVSADGNNDYDG